MEMGSLCELRETLIQKVALNGSESYWQIVFDNHGCSDCCVLGIPKWNCRNLVKEDNALLHLLK